MRTGADEMTGLLLSNDQVREADRRTCERLSSLLLMEQAALQASAVLEQYQGPFLILIGPGNNGGDGLAIARMLISRSCRVDLWFSAADWEWQGDCQANYLFLKALLREQPEAEFFTAASRIDCSRYGCIVDCLFGSGLNRALAAPYDAIIKRVNSSKAVKIAIDIPSGLNGDSCADPGICFRADVTVVFCAYRQAHLLAPAAKYCGRLILVAIGVSDRLIGELGHQGGWWPLNKAQIKLPRRCRYGHKGDFGHLLIVGGCCSSSGALIMAAQAALRSGVGLVSVAGDAEVIERVACQLPDVQCNLLPASPASALDWPVLEDYDALLIGCGWGRSGARRWLLEQLLRRYPGKVVVDADGLYALSSTKWLLPLLADRALLTPHLGEFANLLQKSKIEVCQNTCDLARNYCEHHKITLLLKNNVSLLSSPAGARFFLKIGNDALARGGSGDSLAGLCAGLVAQSCTMIAAGQIAGWVNGRAAELATRQQNRRTVVISRLPDFYSSVFDELDESS